MEDTPAYEYTNSKGTTYYLHGRAVKLRGSGKVQNIYYFAKVVGANALTKIPDGYAVVESTKTGLPVLKRA